MSDTQNIDPDLARLERRALTVGLAAGALAIVGALIDPAQFYRSYLFGYVFWVGIPLGSLAVVMLTNLVNSGWGFIIKRPLESSSRTIPLMALLVVPLLFGLEDLYLWARPEAVAADEILQKKSAYLNAAFFIARTVFYFVIWGGLAYLLSKWSLGQDGPEEPDLGRRLRRISGPGLGVMALTITFSSVDWVMSLDPHWFSTMHGFLFIVSDVLATLAFAICVVGLLHHRKPLADAVSTVRIHDLGNLMMAFVLLWAYIAFSQYLIIWMGNLPEETVWYVHRTEAGWVVMAAGLALFHFAAPFALLLSRRTKRNVQILVRVAVLVLVMRFVDLYWQVAPTFSDHGIDPHWLDLVAPIAIGGLWLTAFARQLKDKALVPLNDPRLEASGEAGGHA
jgi:hypothetical protein